MASGPPVSKLNTQIHSIALILGAFVVIVLFNCT